MTKPIQIADLATAQRNARAGKKLSRAEVNALAIEAQRLQDIVLANWAKGKVSA